MAAISESKITIEFPDKFHFRLEKCKAYTNLSGNHFKEMDICWYEVNECKYWLIELKDYTDTNTEIEANLKLRVMNLLKKAVDSLSIFLASKHNYFYAEEINKCLPFTPEADTEFKFLTIIHCKESQKTDVQLMHNLFRDMFKPYAVLFGIKEYGIIEHESAQKKIKKFRVG